MSRTCFPMLSFLHVPAKMPQPLWLMAGTAFRIAPMCSDTTTASSNNLASATSTSSESMPYSAYFLTAKHTLVPWDASKDASKMKIPNDFRKLRYVICKIYLTDEYTHRAKASTAIPLRVIAVHPNLDVALLGIKRVANTERKNNEVAHMETLLQCSSPPLHMSRRGPEKGELCEFAGYRVEGKLGELDTLDASSLDKLSANEKNALLAELANIEGKQIAVTTHVNVLHEQGMCHGLTEMDICYHGMSGAPLLVSAQNSSKESNSNSSHPLLCGGVLYGHHTEYPQHWGYIPSHDIIDWLAKYTTHTM